MLLLYIVQACMLASANTYAFVIYSWTIIYHCYYTNDFARYQPFINRGGHTGRPPPLIDGRAGARVPAFVSINAP
jgi:hypothetical protein